MSDIHTVSGRITTADGQPADGLDIVVVDADIGFDDPLGHATTHGDGRFEIEFTEDDWGPEFDGTPELVAHGFEDGSTVAEWALELDRTDHELRYEGGGDDEPSMLKQVEEMYHGMGHHRGMTNVPRDPEHPGRGRFGRMFPHLEPADHEIEFLQELGLPGGPLEDDSEDPKETSVPAGFVFLGQFIDHDITLDPLSSLSRQNDPDALRNFRTARLDLDSVYGSGPEVSRFLYESPLAGGERDLLLTGEGDHHLPRNSQDTAIIADPRNDENPILSQFQFAMCNFHNAVVEREGLEFERAQQLVRWHYQWIVLHEYLPTVCDEDIVEEVLEERRLYTIERGEEAYMPLEFAGAAYRFGHSQARLRYRVNEETEGRLLGPPTDPDVLGMGFRPVDPEDAVDWKFLFDMDADVEPQNTREIDPLVSADLLDLPFVTADEPWRNSLASRNLVRGRRLELPSGEAIARSIEGAPVLSKEEAGFDEILEQFGKDYDTEMPLWYYVLAEAKHENDGEHLGPVGSRIVAEVLIGLIETDTSSFLTIQPDWEPTLPNPHSGSGEFTTADLLDYAFSAE